MSCFYIYNQKLSTLVKRRIRISHSIVLVTLCDIYQQNGSHRVERHAFFGLSGGFVLSPAGAIGAACLSDTDCTFATDAQCIIDAAWPGGYCTRLCDDGVCGSGGSCENFECEDGPCALCLSTCLSAGQCRTGEGFTCDSFGTCTPIGLE